MMKKKMNRRKFVKGAAQGAVATAALAGCSTFDKITGASRNPNASSDNGWTVQDQGKFDFIIVGSGAGGGPLAANLANEGFAVLLLEAGGTETDNLSKTPVFHARASDDPLLNWSYFVKSYDETNRNFTTNSKYQQREQGIYYPRASGLGGCTRVNAMISLYPDVNDWKNLSSSQHLGSRSRFTPQEMSAVYRKITGNNGWLNLSQANPLMLSEDPFLLKLALAALSVDGIDSKGELQKILKQIKVMEDATPDLLQSIWGQFTKLVDKVSNIPLAQKAFDLVDNLDGINREILRKAVYEQLNFKLDPNTSPYTDSTNKMNGIFNIPFSVKEGVRHSVRERILDIEGRRPDHLFIQSHALCTKIIFDPNDKTRAIGVEFIDGAHAYRADVKNQNEAVAQSYTRKTAFARREIILSGGAYNTPQLLMLSGIGPKNELPKGIDSVVDRPGVGKNLQDRYEVTVVTELQNPISLIENCTFARNNEFDKDPCWKDYVANPGTHVYGTNGLALSLIRRSTASQPTPDLCIFGLPGKFTGYYPNYSNDTVPKKDGDPSYFTWAILKGHTKNHAGEVKLKTNDPRDTPDINFKYFQGNGAAEDLSAVLEGVKVARDMNSKIGGKYFSKEVYPSKNVQSDSDLQAWIQREAWGHHASCTSKMGLSNDPMAVVDERFRVHGVQNLRVVDASVFPDIPGLFIMLPTLLMSEKAFELILEDQKT